MSQTIDLDTKTFIRFWLVLLSFVAIALFVWKAWNGLLIIGVALFLAIAIRPLAERINDIFLKKKKNDNGQIAAVLGFLIVVSTLVIVVSVIGPVVISETAKFIGQLPSMFEKVLGGWDGINSFGRNIGIEDMRGNILSAVSGVINDFGTALVSSFSAFTNILTSAILSLVLTFFFLLEGPKLYDNFWKKLVGKKKDVSLDEVRRIIGKMSNVVSIYVAKQVSIALLDGAVTAFVVFILALIFGLSPTLAIPMGLITMIFYLIPMFGQVSGCVLVSLILLFSNPLAGIVFAVFYIVYAQIENNGIAPKIQGDALKLSPLIILVSVTIGVYIAGLLGAIVAIPIAGCIKVLIDEYPRIKEMRELKEKNIS